MSFTEVGALLLPKANYEKTKVTDKIDVSLCYRDGSLHLSSNDAGHFYAVILETGNFRKFSFDKSNIKTSSTCNFDSEEPGQLCINGNSISIKEKCEGSPPSGIISGSVGASNAYLFDDSNTVYAFSASVFKEGGSSSKLTKQSKEKAFVGKAKPKPPPPDPKGRQINGLIGSKSPLKLLLHSISHHQIKNPATVTPSGTSWLHSSFSSSSSYASRASPFGYGPAAPPGRRPSCQSSARARAVKKVERAEREEGEELVEAALRAATAPAPAAKERESERAWPGGTPAAASQSRASTPASRTARRA